MPISSSSLFHFTSREIDGITSILKNGFEVSFCAEVERYEDSNDRRVVSSKAIPMVCFCDIPLSLAGGHAKIYCSRENKVFGIGMKQGWGISNGLNPVIYVSNGSYLALLLGNLNMLLNRDQENEFDLDHLIFTSKLKLEEAGVLPQIQSVRDSFTNDVEKLNKVSAKYDFGSFTLEHKLSRLQMYIKPTIGDYFRRGDWIERYNFYNEREWRYIPPSLPEIVCCEEPFYLNEDSQHLKELHYSAEQLGQMCKGSFEKALKPEIPFKFLPFTHQDISFIIVDNQDSMANLVDFILNGDFKLGAVETLTYEARISLVSKLISWEDVMQDIFGN